MRKIGYSVGLEATRERTRDLTEAYVRGKGLSFTDWSELLGEDHWDLSTDRIGKVFAELNLVRVHSGSVDILFGLEALAILRKNLGPDGFDRALSSVLTALILIGDADIFLNCLAASFRINEVETLLLSMIHNKREEAYKVVKLTALREKVDRVVNIEIQKTNRGGAVAGKGIDGLKRTSALEIKEGPLNRIKPEAPTISEDYLRKVPPRRRDWARSLGLFDQVAPTVQGYALLEAFSGAQCRYADGSYSLWPFEPELARLHLTPQTAPWKTLTFEDLINLLQRVFRADTSYSGIEATERWIRSVYDTYRAGNVSKSMLRNELPLRVAYLVQLGTNVGVGKGVQIGCLLPIENGRGSSSIQLRNSRHHEGSLTFKG